MSNGEHPVAGLGKAVVHTAAIQVITTGASAGLTVITAHALGPAGRGLAVLALLAARLAEMALALGLGHALMFYRAGNKWPARELTGAAYLCWGALSLVLGLGCAGLVLAARRLVPAELGASAVWLLALVVSARLLYYCAGSVILGAGGIRTYNWLSAWDSALPTALCLAAAVAGRLTVGGVLLAQTIGSVAMAVGTVRALGLSAARPPLALLRQCLAYGAQIQVGQAALFLNYRLDAFLVGHMLSLRDVGLYSAATAVSELVLRLPNAITTVLYPTVAGAEPGEAAAITGQVSRLSMPAVALACTVIALLGRPTVGLLFGPGFEGALLPMLVLLPGSLFLTLFKLLYHDLAGRGKPGVGMAATISGVLAMVVLDLVLIPAGGITGAALGSTLAYSAPAIWVVCAYLQVTQGTLGSLLLTRRADLELLRGLLRRRRGVPEVR